MIPIPFQPPTAPAGLKKRWDRWVKDAADARDALIDLVKKGREFEVKDDLYKRLKTYYFKSYWGKCAYCEALIRVDQPGDLDHYRPKRAVVDENDRPVMVTGRNGSGKVPHPGYYWLAYDWSNLVPVCRMCNSPGRNGSDELVGKGTRFPVQGAFRARQPGEEKGEKPLLLHPGLPGFDPDQHFTFDSHTGILGGKSRQGRTCIKLLDLNREGLPEERADIYLATVLVLEKAVQLRAALSRADTYPSRERLLKCLTILKSYQNGWKAYSLAGRAALRDNPQLVARIGSLL
jgi:hypothetical protein